MDSVDKSAFYILYEISRNKLVRLGKGYSTKSIHILGILALRSIFWKNLGSLEYLRPKQAPKQIPI